MTRLLAAVLVAAGVTVAASATSAPAAAAELRRCLDATPQAAGVTAAAVTVQVRVGESDPARWRAHCIAEAMQTVKL